MEQRSKEWFEARKERITGSVVGAILGLNPWMKKEDVMRRMVRDYHDAPSEFTGNVATEYGTFNEKNAISDLEMAYGLGFKDCGFFTFENWLGASPDGLNEEAVLEVKCPFSQRDNNPPVFKSAEEQPHYYAQMQIEMFCTDRYKCAFYQWAPYGDRLEWVMRDQDWLDENIPKLKQFWFEYLGERDPWNCEKYLQDKRQEASLPTFIKEYDELTEAIELATARRKELLAEIVKRCGERDSVIDGRKLTKVTRKGNVSYAKLIKDHCPNVDVEPYRGKETSFWKLS